MARGAPDWMRLTRLTGVDADGNIVTILLDESGQLFAILRAVDPDDDPITVRADELGQLYTVVKGRDDNILAVDSEGFLTAVLKGELAGNLYTVAVDSQGYIAAYVLDDESQWGVVVKVGNSELAARLGALQAWDWRGAVVWQTDFSMGLAGITLATSGTGAAAALDPARFLSGGYALKFTGGSDGNRNAQLETGYDIPPTDRIGFSYAFCSDSSPDQIFTLLDVFNGTTWFRCGFRIRPVAGKYDVYKPDTGWTEIGSFQFSQEIDVWHNVKFVIDRNTATYVRALIGNQEIDLTAHSVYQNPSSTARHVFVTMQLVSGAGVNNYAWIDRLILTVNEPS